MVKRQFGLELESFGLTGNQLKKAVSLVTGGNYVDNLHTHHGGVYFDRKTWQGMADGSITGRFATATRAGSHEMVSPVLKGGKGMKDAEKVIKSLNRQGAKVDKSTGLHVTFGLDNSRWKKMGKKKRANQLARIVDTYNWFTPGINTMVAPSRRGNYFARYADLNTSLRQKYSAVNLSQFASGGRVEFRQHQGTLNSKKVREWVNVLDKLLNFSTNEEFKNVDFKDYPRTFDGMAKALRLNPAQTSYWKKRITALGGSSDTGVFGAGPGDYNRDDFSARPHNYTDSYTQGLSSNYSPDWGAITRFQRRHGRVD